MSSSPSPSFTQKNLPSPLFRTSLLLILFFSSLSAAKSQDHSAGDAEIEAGDSTLCPNLASSGSCPVKCFRPDPVCGEDGVTYWCGCEDAKCAGKRVVKVGFCEVGNGGSGSMMGQALLLVHIVWMIVLGFSVVCGFL